jgi:hypothetical protein
MKGMATTLGAIALLGLVLILEHFFPLRRETRSLLARLVVNIAGFHSYFCRGYWFGSTGSSMGATLVDRQTIWISSFICSSKLG